MLAISGALVRNASEAISTRVVQLVKCGLNHLPDLLSRPDKSVVFTQLR